MKNNGETWCSQCKQNEECPLYKNILAEIGNVSSFITTPEVEEYFSEEPPVAILYVEDCPKYKSI